MVSGAIIIIIDHTETDHGSFQVVLLNDSAGQF